LKALTLCTLGTLTPYLFFVIGNLYYSTSGINEYSSRKLLVSCSPIYDNSEMGPKRCRSGTALSRINNATT